MVPRSMEPFKTLKLLVLKVLFLSCFLPETQRYDLCGEQEVDDLLFVCLHQRADHPEAGQPQVLEGSGLGDCVEEGVEVQGYVREQEGGARILVGSDALKERECVAHSVGLVGSQRWRVDCRVNIDYLLKIQKLN